MEQESGHGFGGSYMEMMGAGTARHPQATYQRLREASPVLQVEGLDGPGVIVNRRAEIEEIFRCPEIYSSAMHHGRLGNARPLIPIEIDPPGQRKFRKVLNPLFVPQELEVLEEPVTRLVHELIDGFVDEDEIDFAKQFSMPLPSQVFLTLLGLPLEDLPTFLAMKDGIIRPFHVLGKPVGDPEARAYQVRTAGSIYDYFDKVLDQRELRREEDLLSRLLDTEVDGDRLSREDLLDICFLFLTAGLDTVSASLDCFMAYLAEHHEQRAKLVADPSIIPRVVEELLRWESPVMLVSRVATRDTELGGCPIKAGDEVYAFLGSANTDEHDIPDGNVVRWDRQVNRHLAFGGGIHRCLGSHLARLELRIVLREWHARIPDYRIKSGADLAFTPGVRALDSFRMLLGKSA
ncbi:Cytochrome P450 [Frankia sp. Hr75.2]|nr:Cytochrome P450 [Frankia sp. Hr75.2]